jgi:hypothetical protein
MAKIDENIFNSVSKKASLKDTAQINDDVQRYVMVYDVPKAWIQAIKKNRMTASSYLKQALREKLQRDGML